MDIDETAHALNSVNIDRMRARMVNYMGSELTESATTVMDHLLEALRNRDDGCWPRKLATPRRAGTSTMVSLFLAALALEASSVELNLYVYATSLQSSVDVLVEMLRMLAPARVVTVNDAMILQTIDIAQPTVANSTAKSVIRVIAMGRSMVYEHDPTQSVFSIVEHPSYVPEGVVQNALASFEGNNERLVYAGIMPDWLVSEEQRMTMVGFSEAAPLPVQFV
jgi:hypothetical protein